MARARPKDQVTKKAKAKRAGSASTSPSPSPKRDYPRVTCTVTRPSRASPRKLSIRLHLLRKLESFKADMTSMLSDMLQASFKKFASQFNTNSGGQGNNSNEDTVPKEKFSEATVVVAYDDDNDNSPQRGPEDQSEGEDPPVTVPKRFGGQFESSSLSPNVFISSQTRPVITQVVVQAQSTRSRAV